MKRLMQLLEQLVYDRGLICKMLNIDGLVIVLTKLKESSSYTGSSQTANTFLAAPNGSNGKTSFRTILPSDLLIRYGTSAPSGIALLGLFILNIVKINIIQYHIK